MYLNHKESIMCNLTKDVKSFPIGFEPFETYQDGESCKLCKKFSRPIEIRSDVFLTVQPRVQNIILKKIDAPKFLSPFIDFVNSYFGIQWNTAWH